MSAFPGDLIREGLALTAWLGAPIFGALLVTGLVVGIFQAATQINDPAIGFLVRLGAAGIVCWMLGGWMTDRLAVFFTDSVQRMGNPF
ncbi:flagellar biosynthetic protein FliQ [Vulgatibacter incomptus]|uniref:Flagellar biosynthesis protein FliQ n=1 Tax=Vulgatibacter incomptus TaxID=1391653 RepID=A0A0K1PHM1_9BACT|nr:flagellar biosynthetic protein FliQ [Vulgatibacter incomptus]AKU93012.1 Flagellar biosynthesis protein FliQ [Vulgatibacter incomptus]